MGLMRHHEVGIAKIWSVGDANAIMRVLLSLALLSTCWGAKVPLITDAMLARSYLEQVNSEGQRICNLVQLATWNYETNITEENARAQLGPEEQSFTFYKQVGKNVTLFDVENFPDPKVQRQFVKAGWSRKPVATLSSEEIQELMNISSRMTDIYSTTQICSYNDSEKCNLNLDPELTAIMDTSRDYEQLLYVWREWHEQAGRPIRPLFTRFVQLKNKAARLAGYEDAGEKWQSEYESDTFAADVHHLWQNVRPLYLQLHAYVRRKLRQTYGDVVPIESAIPAHILGNMWAQNWLGVEDLVRPYPSKKSPNPAPEMVHQNFTGRRLYEIANEFFTSMGMISVPETFWNLSMFERPEDRKVVCHGSASNFCDGKDFRVKVCAQLTLDDLLTAHHELGHVQYYMQYKDQPYLFQEGANPAFHESIGDVLTLSVTTVSHLNRLGLLPDFQDDDETSLNLLMQQALKKVAFLPFGFVLDQWRWKVFSGDIPADQYNAKWWYLRTLYQGVVPAVSRSEEDFDPGAKHHVPMNTPYVRYFVAHILQFQIHQALCLAAGLYEPNNASKPLHKCDIYGSTKAGMLFSKMLHMGSSQPWPEALFVITQNKTKMMDVQPMLEYFQPLMDFLVRENKKNKDYIGWKDSATRAQFPCMILGMLVGFIHLLSFEIFGKY